MEKMMEKTCRDFTEDLASKAPVPGGGGAAALAGALGTALCAMVGNFTSGKKRFAPVQADVERMLTEAAALQKRLLALADEDAVAFAPLSRAYTLPKDDPERERILESATKNACLAPAEMVHCCAQSIALLEEMLDKGSRMLISDVGCGALLCRAAMESAAMNVFVNTASLRDRAYAQRLEAEMDALIEEFSPRAGAVIAAVTEYIRK